MRSKDRGAMLLPCLLMMLGRALGGPCPTAPEGYSYSEKADMYYYFGSNRENFAMAFETCKNTGGRLAMPKTTEQLEYLYDQIGGRGDYWIGIINPLIPDNLLKDLDYKVNVANKDMQTEYCSQTSETQTTKRCNMLTYMDGEPLIFRDAMVRLVDNGNDACYRLVNVLEGDFKRKGIEDRVCSGDYKPICEYSCSQHECAELPEGFFRLRDKIFKHFGPATIEVAEQTCLNEASVLAQVIDDPVEDYKTLKELAELTTEVGAEFWIGLVGDGDEYSWQNSDQHFDKDYYINNAGTVVAADGGNPFMSMRKDFNHGFFVIDDNSKYEEYEFFCQRRCNDTCTTLPELAPELNLALDHVDFSSNIRAR